MGEDGLEKTPIRENAMTDWADGIQERNYGIRNEINANVLSEMMGVIIPLAAIAGVLLSYSWIRSQIINTGYESQQLFAQEQSLLRTKKSLALEEETLRNPERIDLIARLELGMTPLRAHQVVLPRIQDLGAGDAMAMTAAQPQRAIVSELVR